MIAREWKCKCPTEKKDGFIAYLYETGVNDASIIQGFLGAQLFSRAVNQKAEIILITYWDTYDSIKAFSGDNIDKARLYPEDGKFDLEPELCVIHYEVIEHRFKNGVADKDRE